jgi:predicted TIM-barrel fold metal-dependent hydrolase
MVMQINQTQPEWAMKELDRVINKGARAVGLMASSPPAEVSPASEVWDPYWARLQEADVVATLHLGCGGLLSALKSHPMLPDRNWANAASLKGTPANRPGGEEAISPYFMLVAHMPAELYLQTMVMGSVFERFPRLRLGVIELGAGWLGPCVERMDLWVDFMGKVGRKYPMRPSEYVNRNVRITPFWHENLARMIERFGLEGAYVFSTDYPHLEGSRDPIGKFRKWLSQLPADYARKFFVENGELLFPGL